MIQKLLEEPIHTEENGLALKNIIDECLQDYPEEIRKQKLHIALNPSKRKKSLKHNIKKNAIRESLSEREECKKRICKNNPNYVLLSDVVKAIGVLPVAGTAKATDLKNRGFDLIKPENRFWMVHRDWVEKVKMTFRHYKGNIK